MTNYIYYLIFKLSVKGIIKHPMNIIQNLIKQLLLGVILLSKVLFLTITYKNPISLVTFFIFDNDAVTNFITKKLLQIYNITVNKKLNIFLELVIYSILIALGFTLNDNPLIILALREAIKTFIN